MLPPQLRHVSFSQQSLCGVSDGLVSNEVLHLSLSDVRIHKLEDIIGITRGLSKLDGDRSGLVRNQVLHLAFGDVLVHQFEDVVSVAAGLGAAW